MLCEAFLIKKMILNAGILPSDQEHVLKLTHIVSKDPKRCILKKQTGI